MSWVERFSPSRRPTFYFKHVLLPHSPWMYLPSGHTYYNGPSENGVSWEHWYSIPWLIQQKYQRHLLQLEFTDRLLGRVLDKLHATGIYDRSLIVVTADHGESFGRPGNGRQFDRRTVGDIALKPLFVKLPFQHAGGSTVATSATSTSCRRSRGSRDSVLAGGSRGDRCSGRRRGGSRARSCCSSAPANTSG